MPELHQIALRLAQQALYDLDVNDAVAVRAWRRLCIETEVSLAGGLPLRMVHVGADFSRSAPLEDRLDPDADKEQRSVFMACARMPDVVRSYREGEITIEHEGARVRAVVTLEYHYPSGRWWTAQRRIGTNAVAVGVFHGEWQERAGEGLEALGEPLRDWVDPEGIELVDQSFRSKLTPKPEPRLGYGRSTLNRRPPPDPLVYADIVANLRDEEAIRGKLPEGFEIFAFEGVELEWFVLTEAPSVPVDDLVRAIAARGPAEAMVVRYMGVVDIDGESHRAIFSAVECAGRRLDRVLALRPEPGQPHLAWRVVHNDRGPVPPEGCWIGVAPKHGEIELFSLAPDGTPIES